MSERNELERIKEIARIELEQERTRELIEKEKTRIRKVKWYDFIYKYEIRRREK